MSKYQPYPSYKSSGVEWLGEVPEHWSIYQLKRTVNGCNNGIWGNEPDGESDLIVLRVADFNRDNFTISLLKLTMRAISQQERKSRLLKKGDLLIEKSGGGDNQLVGAVVSFEHDMKAVTSNFVAKMTPVNGYQYRFLTYAFAHLYSGRINYMSIKQNTGIQNLDSNQYLSEYFVFPTYKEQTAIANFLDRETSKIDTLIEKQQWMIELLKEKRQVVISHAITKGLDPNVKMKDSEVEWVKNIPVHWEVGLLSSLFNDNKEKNIGLKNDNLLSLSYGRIKKKDIDTNEGLLPASFETYQVVHPGYIVLRLTDLQNDKKSLRTGLVKEKGIITSAYTGLVKKSKSIGDERYFHLYLHTFDIHKGFYGMGAGVRQGLNFDELKKLRFLLPPSEEQTAIVNFLDRETSKIDTLIEKAKKAIDLLKERRTALISAAVTGKIDVRGVV